MPTERIVEILNERHGCNMPVKETAKIKEELYLQGIEEIAPIEPKTARSTSFSRRRLAATGVS